MTLAENAYDIDLNSISQIGGYLFVCLLYFLSLAALFKIKGDLAKILIIILAVAGYIALFACVLEGLIWLAIH